jgi:hypothetical protein
MTPQLTKIAECLSESHAREIKLARCLAESLKRIQTLESASKTKDTKAKAAELRFNAAMRKLSEHYAKRSAETEELIRQMEEAIKVDFPAQIAALKAEFATPAAQAAAPQSFNPRGAYEPGEKYKPFDYVSSNGSSYIALVENPTQPPSKKSKQWMLVAARGAGGGVDSGGGVTGLGTAAYRDVGQAAGNVLELSAAGKATLGGGVVNGELQIWNQDEGGYVKLYPFASQIKLENANGGFLLLDNGNFGGTFNFAYNTTYRDYDFPNASGTLALLSQVGDRYLTSSTTSNTVSNGAKTFIIGTGLAYSPTQDITIVFDAAHHMHAEVTSYNSTTGVLVVDVNHNTGSGTYAVWTVNVGGIGAGAIPSGGTTGQVLAKVSNANYDDAWVTPTVATTTTAGTVPGIGTADTATTNALTVADYLLVPPAIMAWERVTAAVTGSGTSEGNSGIYYGVGTGVTASSTSRVDSNTSSGDPWYFGNYNTGTFGATDRYIINGIFLRISSTSTGVWRFGIGKTHAGAVGQWTEAGFGFVCKNLRLWSFTHNGTTYTENDTGVDIPSGEIPMQFCILRNSTAHLFYLNRTLVATHTATGYANGRFIRIEAENGANSAAQRMRISPVTLRFL